MDLTLYQELTGKTVPASQETYYKAVLLRVRRKLETILGWSFTPQALYTEKGKTQRECVCPDIPQTLSDPDEVKGIIKVFPYNSKDRYLHVDPYNDVYAVKLVRVLENREFVTYKTFELFTKQYEAQGIGKYIEKCQNCFCDCDCKNCIQLAVDADWIDVDDPLPDDLLYLWCDMVDYYGDPTHDIKSESVDGHSWSKGDVKAPEESAEAILLLKKYAGPFGTITHIPTV